MDEGMIKSSFGWIELKNYSADPTDTEAARRGICMVDTVLKKWTGTTWTAVTGDGGVGSWDTLYDNDKVLDIDDGTLTFNVTTDTDGLTIAGGASADAGALLQFSSVGDAVDVRGTGDSWWVTKAGLFNGTDATLDSITIGSGAATGIIDSSGNYNLQLKTGHATTCDILLTAGGDGDIDVTLNGTGAVNINGTTEGSDSLVVAAGDVAVTLGSIIAEDNDNDGPALSITNDTMTDYSAAADSGMVLFTSASITTATLLELSLNYTELAGGYFFRCWDSVGGTAEFTIAEYGATVITGNAEGTAALTLTDGDIVVTDGDIVVSAGSVDITEDATDNVALVVATAGTSVDAVTITADALTGTEAALSISVDALVDGRGIKVENVGETITTGELLTILNTESGELAAKSGNLVSVTSDLEEDTGTVTSNYDMVLFSRADTQAAAAQYDAQGSVVKILKTLDKAAGTIVDAVIGLEIESAIANAALPLGDTVKITEVGVGATALNIIAAGVGADDVHIAGSGAHSSDKAVLNVTASGAIGDGGNIVRVDAGAIDAHGGAVFVEFDFANLGNTSEPTGVVIDGDGKKLVALTVDADPVAGDVVYFHSDAAIKADKGILRILHETGVTADGAALLRITEGAAGHTGSMALEIDAQNDSRAIFVDSDAATNHAVEIAGTGDLGANKAMLFVTSSGTALVAGSSLVRIEDSAGMAAAGATVYGLEIDIDGDDMEALLVTAGTCTFSEAITVSAGGAAITGNSSIDGALVINDSSADVDMRVESNGNENCFYLDAGNDNVTINATSVSTHYDLMVSGTGILGLKEGATPTADAGYGKIYCKDDNKLYFQTGAGTEKEIAFV